MSDTLHHLRFSLFQCAEDFPDDVAGGACRILAEFLFLLGDHQVEAVERFFGDIVFDRGFILADQAERGALSGEGIVLLCETDG